MTLQWQRQPTQHHPQQRDHGLYSDTAAITPNELLTVTIVAQSSPYSYDQTGDTTGITSTGGISTTLSAVRLTDGTTVVLAYNATPTASAWPTT